MNKISLIRQARAKQQERLVAYLKKAFEGFACPVYLFGAYATGRYHGGSDVDILIVSPNALSSRYYLEACDKMSGVGGGYDILMSPSIKGLDGSIIDTLQPLNSPDRQHGCQSMPKQQTGLTLIELMVAMLIGLFLIGGVVQIFISTKQTYRLQENLSRVQENGRFAMGFIDKDIRMAGFQGCGSIDIVAPNPVDALPIIPGLNTVITGNEATQIIPATWMPALPAVAPLAGTDAITLLHGNSCGGNLTAPMLTTTDNIQIPATNTCGINPGAALLVADCANADIFLATAGTADPSIAHTALSVAYLTNAELFTYTENSYFIRNGAGGQPALWRFDNARAAGGNNPAELIEGIEDMQILYGEDTDPLGANGKCTVCTPNYYVTADNVVSPGRIVSIRISLLVATPDDNIAAQPLTYIYNGMAVTPNDRRVRRVFTSTISLRNRLS